MLATLKLQQMGVNVRLFGGYEHAERQMAAFFPPSLSFDWEYPIDCLKLSPKALRFSEDLGHRDYLGAVLNLGVDRSVVGDILLKDKEAWLFCQHKMSDFFIENLTRVRHTMVLVTRVDQAGDIPGPEFEGNQWYTALLSDLILLSDWRFRLPEAAWFLPLREDLYL